MSSFQQRISRLLWDSLSAGVLAALLLGFGWSLVHDESAEAAQQRVLRARGEEAVAEITSFRLQGRAAVVTLRYTTQEGRVVTLPDQDLSGPDGVGRRVVVWYDPEDPSAYATDVHGDGLGFGVRVGQAFLVAGAAAGACAVGLLTAAVVVEAREGS